VLTAIVTTRKRTCSWASSTVGKLNKDISFALRRGTIAQVTTALDAALRFAEDELALNEAGWDRLLFFLPLRCSDQLISYYAQT
jgi:hypothetical protein